jgi:hypothetical protein
MGVGFFIAVPIIERGLASVNYNCPMVTIRYTSGEEVAGCRACLELVEGWQVEVVRSYLQLATGNNMTGKEIRLTSYASCAG